MFNKNNARCFMLMAVVASLGSVSAFADGGASSQPASIPTPTQRAEEFSGRCQFAGSFDNGKGTGFAMNCRARFEFDRRERDKDIASERERDRDDDFLRVECDGQRIYRDGVRARFLGEDNGHHDRDVDLLLTGRGEGSPRILIKDLDLRDRGGHDALDSRRRDDRNENLRSAITFQANGFVYTLQGRCDVERERHGDGHDDLVSFLR